MLLGFTGDLFLGSELRRDALTSIAAELPKDAQLVVNFEGTLFCDRQELTPARRKILLDSPATLLPMMDRLPIAVASVGNNHIGDYGNAVARRTIELLSERYPVLGAGYLRDEFHLLVRTFDECRIGFANYCTRDTTPLFCTEERIGPRPLTMAGARQDLVKLLSSGADQCIALVHWGDEYFHHPRPAQVRIARRLIDAGYAMVIGHHSHSAQGAEMYKGRWIFYSLGNFHFPDHTVRIDERDYSVRWMPRKAWGLMPFFKVSNDSIHLQKVRITYQSRGGASYFTKSPFLQWKFQKYSRNLASPGYIRRYRRLLRVESLGVRYEEFLNNEHKFRTVFRKLGALARPISKLQPT
jgi:hypothetical protein